SSRRRYATSGRCVFALVFPQPTGSTLFPYTTLFRSSAYDDAFRALMAMRRQPAVRTAPAYPDDPGYIAALAASVRHHLAALDWRSEEHTSELQSRENLVCRLLLEKKKTSTG